VNDFMPPSGGNASGVGPADDPRAGADSPRSACRHAFLLGQLAAQPAIPLSQAQANRKIPAAVRRDLEMPDLEANRVREALAAAGYLRMRRTGRSVTVELTDEGRQYLQSLPRYTPPGSGRSPVRPPADARMARWRESYLLLQLLKAEHQTLPQREANQFDTLGRKYLELNAATARQLRRQFAAEGLLTVERDGRQERYTLTDRGRLHLGALELYEAAEFRLKGDVLNRLLEAAREAAKQFEATAAEPRASPPPARLTDAVWEAFQDLRREAHHRTGAVPIHEVRRHVRSTYGDEAARHDVLDEVILGLWRSGRIRLASLFDPGKATAEQLRDSIPGVGETLFYMEAAREPAVR
jgi:predicted transcriptional regulator